MIEVEIYKHKSSETIIETAGTHSRMTDEGLTKKLHETRMQGRRQRCRELGRKSDTQRKMGRNQKLIQE